MTYSMTGFAQARRDTELGQLGVELRTLNHRYFEAFFRLPEELRAAEPDLRDLAAGRVRRGKLEVSVRYRPAAGAAVELRFNARLAKQLAALEREAAAVFTEARPADLAAWLAWPGVVESPEADLSPVKEALLEAMGDALDDLLAHRAREGEKLAGLIRERLAEIERIAADVRGWLPEIREQAATRLKDKVAALTESALDPGRLEQEIAMILQRLDVDEELDRLDAHVQEVQRTLRSKKPIGRRLDFLMQELNREANTLGSKTVDTRLNRASVELKVLIEQMREQVQNIE
ncbi:MAG: YicC/YloC family endoribonuclease [Pseudomonadota bacterium]